MGINGLTSFLNKSYIEEILDDLKLCNCTLLIDGYSLLYKLHYFNNIQSFYGGNYDELSVKLNEFFVILKKCKIQPIVLLGKQLIFTFSYFIRVVMLYKNSCVPF